MIACVKYVCARVYYCILWTCLQSKRELQSDRRISEELMVFRSHTPSKRCVNETDQVALHQVKISKARSNSNQCNLDFCWKAVCRGWLAHHRTLDDSLRCQGFYSLKEHRCASQRKCILRADRGIRHTNTCSCENLCALFSSQSSRGLNNFAEELKWWITWQVPARSSQ